MSLQEAADARKQKLAALKKRKAAALTGHRDPTDADDSPECVLLSPASALQARTDCAPASPQPAAPRASSSATTTRTRARRASTPAPTRPTRSRSRSRASQTRPLPRTSCSARRSSCVLLLLLLLLLSPPRLSLTSSLLLCLASHLQDLTNIQPKKPNWDLKRDLDRKVRLGSPLWRRSSSLLAGEAQPAPGRRSTDAPHLSQLTKLKPKTDLAISQLIRASPPSSAPSAPPRSR